MTAIVLEKVSAGYLEDVPVVRDFSATIESRKITTLIGANGAGKSTLLKTIFGLTRQFGGRILMEGVEIQSMPPWRRFKIGLGYVPQGRSNFPYMSVRENLQVASYTLPSADRGRAMERVLTTFPVLRGRLRDFASSLSGGQQQILEMAMVLESNPRVLLLDEPSIGLSPRLQSELFEEIRRLAGDLTVIMVEQHVRAGLEVSDNAIVMEQGVKFLEGDAKRLLEDERVKFAYLGAPVETNVQTADE